MSGSKGSIKRKGSRGVEGPRQLRRTVSRTKQREGGASGSTSVLTKHKGEGKVEQKSLNKITLKAIIKTNQTRRDLSSTVWDTLLIKASSPEADKMQKQAQTNAEKVRQEGKGHTRGPPFVWACLGLVKSLQQMGNGVGTGHSDILGQTGVALSNADLRRGTFLQAGQNVQSRHPESSAEHCFSGEAAPKHSVKQSQSASTDGLRPQLWKESCKCSSKIC